MILINPKSTKFGIFQRYVPLSVPIGLGYLAAYLLMNGRKAEVVDEHIDPLSRQLVNSLLENLSPPYIFGISTLTACAQRSYEIAGRIKDWYPDSIIILGGIHPTVLPEEALGNTAVDFVVRGEGEEILLELYDAIKNRKDHSRIKGLSYKNGSKLIHNPPAELPVLEDFPPFPYHLFEKGLGKYNFSFISSSRGCPYDCIFCSQRSISGKRFRYVPESVVLDQIELLVNKYEQGHINFVDDNFTADKQRVIRLCRGIREKGLQKKASFDCQTRADAVDDELLISLKSSGFRMINYGLETASERLMVLLNKKETVAENIAAVKLTKKYGFGVSGTFIFGLPTETREERWKAYKLAKELDLDYVRFNNPTPYPGTKLYEIAKSEGRLFVEEGWANLNACASLVQDSLAESRLPYLPQGCEENELKRDIIRANLFFSLRPMKVFKLLVKRIGPAGWFYLPPRWYLNPEEWWGLVKLGSSLLRSLAKIYL
ncbi:MAG: radical SAM protein [Candidatus Omnitrophica bacterium]|nr:radical SAM protein [Candidatus Omnitrophota bacterium]